MIVLGEVHLPPIATVPVLAGLLVCVAVYWRRLSRGSVPGPRRRLRRAGLAVGVVVASMATMALSLLDPAMHPSPYLVAWSVVLLLLAPAVLIAIADAIFTIRLHQRSLERRLLRDAVRIRREVESASTGAMDADSDDRTSV
jgi:uncharacterized protein YjeT (DUF2065 family)